jgi:hypothetical protein
MGPVTSLAVKTERKRMLTGWIFAGAFFLLTFISSFMFGSPNGRLVAPGVIIMTVMSTILIVLSVYIYYVSTGGDQ